MMLPKLGNLRRVREERFLTQQDLAEKSGVSRVTILRIEQGVEARISTARKLADALSVEPSELVQAERTGHE
jgi:predicted transcriptional regulator